MTRHATDAISLGNGKLGDAEICTAYLDRPEHDCHLVAALTKSPAHVREAERAPLGRPWKPTYEILTTAVERHHTKPLAFVEELQ